MGIRRVQGYGGQQERLYVDDATAGPGFDAFLTVFVALGAVVTPVPLNVQSFVPDPAAYSHTPPSSDVTVLQTGRYAITADVTAFQFLSNVRSEAFWQVFRDPGAGFAPIPGSNMFTYHRNAAAGVSSASTTLKVDCTAGDVLRIGGSVFAGTGLLFMVPQACSLTLELEDPP